MISNFTKTTLSIIGEKKDKIHDPEGKIKNIEGKLNNNDIDLPKAMEMLREIFSYNLSEDDYRKIQKEVGYDVRR